VIGIGGIMCAADALEFLIAGASAIQIGTANFVNPDTTERVVEGIAAYLQESGCQSVNEIIGSLQLS
jgi:dihydroorotate dehydrogenase (NAD+) catalytic subunit